MISNSNGIIKNLRILLAVLLLLASTSVYANANSVNTISAKVLPSNIGRINFSFAKSMVEPRNTVKKAKAKHLVKAIDFNRKPDGSGQITVLLSSNTIKVNVKQESGLLRVDILNTQVPNWLRRKFDVTAFGTAVQDLQANNVGQTARLLIKTKMNALHVAYQLKNKYIIDIKSATQVALNPLQKKIKQDSVKCLSLNFQTIPVRSALQLLAQFAHINMAVSDTVTGDITLRLNHIRWKQALDIIMKTRGLGEQKIGNTYIIASVEEMAKQKKEELKAQQQIQVLEPLHSELIQINYGKATKIATLLKNSGQAILSDRGTVSVDERMNTLWVQDTSQKLAEIKKLVARLDRPAQQVLIEAKIVNVDKKYEKELGIRWGLSRQRDAISGTLEGANEIANGANTSEVNLMKRLNVDLPAAGVGSMGGAASVGIALAKLGKGFLLDLELSALQTTGDAKIIASPRLITANQTQAIIESGEEIPYQESTSSGATSVTFKKAVLSLKVTPQITPDNRVILKLRVNQDKPGPKILAGIPSIDTREIQTQVLVNNGQTIVLGGIFQKSISSTIERIPFLSHIPVIGHLLFQHTQRETKQTELLIFVTPKIIKRSLYKP